jgi:hypothetical protein
MAHATTSGSNSSLETWLERHIAHHWRVELISAIFTLVLAFGATVLAMVILAYWIGLDIEFLWLVPVGLVLTFASYPFVTPKPLPFIGWLREHHDADPLRDFYAQPFAVRYYFWDGYLGLSAIYWAPLLFHMAAEEFRKALAIRTLDRRSVIAAMRLLAERDSRVMWYEFERTLPSLPLETLQRQLSLVDGVVFLKNEPAGATLTDALRAEIQAAL